MSTARGSEPRGGPQQPGEHAPLDTGSFDPALGHLISALTVPGHPHEKAGRDAALAAFRAAGQPHRRAARRAQALPAPMQDIAYTVFAPLGVPDSNTRPSASRAPARITPSARGVAQSGSSGNTAARGGASPASAASPSTAATSYTVTLNVARAQLPTGAFAKFTGKVGHHGRTATGERVWLLERTRGASGWQVVASGRIGRLGRVRFSVLPPTAIEQYVLVLAAPDGRRSAPVTVTVQAPLTVRLAAGKATDRLHVVAPFSKRGTTVALSEEIDGTWTRVANTPLGVGHRAVFVLSASTAGGHLYRVELPASALTSNPLWIPARHTGAKVITAPPSPTGTSSPSPTPSPTASPGPTTAPSPPSASETPTASSTPTASGTPSATSSPSAAGSPAPSASPSSAASAE